MFISDSKAIFLIDEEVELPLVGVDINFLISPGLMLIAVVELTNKVESSLPIASSVTKALSSDSLL